MISASFEDQFQVAAGHHRFRHDPARQKFLIDPRTRDALDDFGLVRPQSNLMGTFASENDGEAGAPGPCSDDGYLAHLGPKENLGSWPAKSRLIFAGGG